MAGELAEAFGCTAQVLAASRTACVEAFRRLPQPHPSAWRSACDRIDGAAGIADLERAAAVVRRLPLAAWQRSALRERYAERRTVLPR